MTPEQPGAIVLDANVIVAWCTAPEDDRKKRLRHLLEVAEKDGRRVIIPTPAMAEFLVKADTAGIDIYNALEKMTKVYVAPFDRRAAFECSLLDGAALNRGDKRDGSNEPYQKIKIDRQIVAIAKVQGATLVIAEDGGVRNVAKRVGMEAKMIEELQLPPEPPQQKLPFPDPVVDEVTALAPAANDLPG